MGTRSMIGMAGPRNEVHYVFVFMDGFPSWNGSILTRLGTREFAGTLPEGVPLAHRGRRHSGPGC